MRKLCFRGMEIYSLNTPNLPGTLGPNSRVPSAAFRARWRPTKRSNNFSVCLLRCKRFRSGLFYVTANSEGLLLGKRRS